MILSGDLRCQYALEVSKPSWFSSSDDQLRRGIRLGFHQVSCACLFFHNHGMSCYSLRLTESGRCGIMQTSTYLPHVRYFCEIDPHPLLPYVEVHEVVETEDGPIVTTMLVEKEDLYQVPVEFPATTALPSPPPLVLVPPMAMQPQQERLVHCKDESCGVSYS